METQQSRDKRFCRNENGGLVVDTEFIVAIAFSLATNRLMLNYAGSQNLGEKNDVTANRKGSTTAWNYLDQKEENVFVQKDIGFHFVIFRQREL